MRHHEEPRGEKGASGKHSNNKRRRSGRTRKEAQIVAARKEVEAGAGGEAATAGEGVVLDTKYIPGTRRLIAFRTHLFDDFIRHGRWGGGGKDWNREGGRYEAVCRRRVVRVHES